MKLRISTKGFNNIVDITPEIEKIVKEARFEDGLVFIFLTGTTAGLTIMEYEPGAIKDLKSFFEKIAPQGVQYEHDKARGDANGFSHVRAALLGPTLFAPVEKGKLQLGRWQSIVLVDFDNRPREREIIIEIISAK